MPSHLNINLLRVLHQQRHLRNEIHSWDSTPVLKLRQSLRQKLPVKDLFFGESKTYDHHTTVMTRRLWKPILIGFTTSLIYVVEHAMLLKPNLSVMQGSSPVTR